MSRTYVSSYFTPSSEPSLCLCLITLLRGWLLADHANIYPPRVIRNVLYFNVMWVMWFMKTMIGNLSSSINVVMFNCSYCCSSTVPNWPRETDNTKQIHRTWIIIRWFCWFSSVCKYMIPMSICSAEATRLSWLKLSFW